MDIYVGAMVATVLSVAIYGYVIKPVTAGERSTVLAAVLLAVLAVLPLILLIYPFQARWQTQLLDTRFLRALAALIEAPLIEEPAKWLVLFLPWIRRSLRTDTAVPIALAIGVGFAVGENWTQAYSFVGSRFLQDQDPLFVSTWTVGRLTTPVVHGGLVAFVAIRLAAGRPIWPGALIGLTLHWIANLPLLARHSDAVLGNAQPMVLTLANLANLAVIIVLGLFVAKGLLNGLGLNFRESFMGKQADRLSPPQDRARLVIAKLDQLSRNLAFIATPMNPGLSLCRLPFANKLTVQILAVAVAQDEREMISERTRSALPLQGSAHRCRRL